MRILDRSSSIPVSSHSGLKEFSFDNSTIMVERSVEIMAADHSIIIHADRDNKQELFVENGWISREYGVKIPAPVLRYKSTYNGQNLCNFIIESKLD